MLELLILACIPEVFGDLADAHHDLLSMIHFDGKDIKYPGDLFVRLLCSCISVAGELRICLE